MEYFAQLTTHILDPNPFIGIPTFGYQWNKQYEDLNHGFLAVGIRTSSE